MKIMEYLLKTGTCSRFSEVPPIQGYVKDNKRCSWFSVDVCTIENAGIPLFCQKAPGKRGSKLLPERVL